MSDKPDLLVVKQSSFTEDTIQSIENINELLGDTYNIHYHVIADSILDEEVLDVIQSKNTVSVYRYDDINTHLIGFGVPAELIARLEGYTPVYKVLLLHYLRYQGFTYALIVDDNVRISDAEALKNVSTETPFMPIDVVNPFSDKGLFCKISTLFQNDITPHYIKSNPMGYGLSTKAAGVQLNVFNQLMTENALIAFLNLFDYDGIYVDSILGEQREYSHSLLLANQAQSCIATFSCILSDPIILDVKYAINEGVIDLV